MNIKHLTVKRTHSAMAALLIIAAFVLSACAGAVQPQVVAAPNVVEKQQAPLQFFTHVQLGMAEQDVFVETEEGTVRRIVADEAEQYADAPVYGTAIAVAHDPFGLKPELMNGFEKGEDLGVSMGEWLASTGSGTYTVAGEKTELDLSFENLVPNGVYTLWCVTITAPPSFRIVDIACGNPYGTENTVIADAQGGAQARLMTTTMPDAAEGYMPAVVMAYHSDGKTYGEFPGDFGLNSHVQIIAFVPAPGDAAWQAVE
jgi:hypothetical protein